MKKFIQYTISFGLIALFVSIIYQKFSPQERQQIVDNLMLVSPIYILAILSMASIACFLRAYRWSQLLEPMQYHPSKVILICSIFVMYLANFVFPRLGEVIRCSILSKYENIPIEKSVGTMLVERIIDTLSMGIILLFTLVIEKDKLMHLYQLYLSQKGDRSSSNIFIISSGVAVIIAFILYKNTKIQYWIKERIKGLWEGIQSVFHLKNPLLFILYTIGINLMYLLSCYIFYFAVLGTKHLPFSSSFLVLVSNTLGVALTPNGIGASQLLITEALEMYNIPYQTGMEYAWGLWIFSAIAIIVGGLISLLVLNLLYYSNGKKN